MTYNILLQYRPNETERSYEIMGIMVGNTIYAGHFGLSIAQIFILYIVILICKQVYQIVYTELVCFNWSHLSVDDYVTLCRLSRQVWSGLVRWWVNVVDGWSALG